jgi:formate--tetrahydrofolate ligase
MAPSLRPILEVAADLDLPSEDLVSYGPVMAKLSLAAVKRLERRGPRGRLVLVSAINPTPHGEGKTTVSIGLAQGLRRLNQRVALALREPSMGPVFGAKGGGTGGGRCTMEPSAQINLHFTGDLHAIASAHNLLAALVDNAIYFGGRATPDARQVTWRRSIDMNDRFLRRMVIGLGGKAHGVPREDSFDITAASEIMAILCLARDIPDLKLRLGRIIVGLDGTGSPVTASQLQAVGAMSAILADALQPNLVQTTEGCPAFVHGGPFGNIAHGCNSIIATRSALASADLVVTEAGFGFDLGAEKFLDIKCRTAGFWPSAAVLVVTARALRSHGGDAADDIPEAARLAALERGLTNLDQHLQSARSYGLNPVVAINRFPVDTESELKAVEAAAIARGARVARFDGFSQGGAGAESLARQVLESLQGDAPTPRYAYELSASPQEKLKSIARQVYGARDVLFTREAQLDLERIEKLGLSGLPVCVAKTHLSLTDDPRASAVQGNFDITVRSLRVSAGAGYILALTGEIVTMPGLPRLPASAGIDLTEDGEIVGLH